MTRQEALSLVDTLMNAAATNFEKQIAADRLSELLRLLLPETTED
jgi:hypothetical protein